MLIVNGQVVVWGDEGTIISDGAVLIEGDRIAAIGTTADLLKKYPTNEVIDANGGLIMPGNICAHTHFYGAFARGLAIPGDAPKNFPEILERLWWKLDQCLTLDAIKYSALVCLVDAIKQGTTTLIDHHASATCVEGSLDVISQSVKESGLRGVLCYEVSDRHGMDYAKEGIMENVRFIEKLNGQPENRLRGMFGLHASMTLSDDTLAACVDAIPDGAGFHIHVAEHQSDQTNSQRVSGVRVVERLHKFGILNQNTIAAHCVHLDNHEISLLSETGAWVTHQPRSNMNNGVGVADVESLIKNGIQVGLGNDGFSNNMWSEWQTAYLLHKVSSLDPRKVQGDLIVDMGINNNSSLASQLFNDIPLGVMEVGGFADIIIVDYLSTTPLSYENLPWHIIFGFESGLVNSTICAGKVLMKNRELMFLDEVEIFERSRELAKTVWDKF